MLGQERARLGEGRLTRVRVGRGRGAMTDRQRVEHAAAPTALAGQRGPMEVHPQPMRSGGKGSSVENVPRPNAVTGPISTNASRARGCPRADV